MRTALGKLSRPQRVWLGLLSSLCCVAALLLALTPPVPPSAIPAPAAATEEPTADISSIFDLSAAVNADQWSSIVIHDSGSPMGSAEDLARRDEAMGLRGLGLHFVITNGQGGADGEIQIGYRWDQQLPGAHVVGPQSSQLNRTSIGIALIGDGERRAFTDAQIAALRTLVDALSEQLDIPAERVLLHRDIAPVRSPGRLFPESAVLGHG